MDDIQIRYIITQNKWREKLWKAIVFCFILSIFSIKNLKCKEKRTKWNLLREIKCFLKENHNTNIKLSLELVNISIMILISIQTILQMFTIN